VTTIIKDNPVANYIVMVVVSLMAIGTVFVFSAGANISQDLDLQKFYNYPALRQILFFPLACLIMFAVSCFDYRRFSLAPTSSVLPPCLLSKTERGEAGEDKRGWMRSPTTYLLVLSVVLLILVLLPQFGMEINRARRWFRIPAGPITVSFQPSELAKWAIIVFLAGVCDRFATELKLYWKRFVPICFVVGLVAGLIVIEDFGTAAFISLLAFLMLIIAGVKWWHILTPLPLAAAAFLAVLIRSPSRMQRIIAFLHPEKLTDSAAYQANQSLVALGSGGLFGKGLGRGICKYGHLPEDTTDFIFAIIGEELGFIGDAVVIGLFIAFVCLGILVILRCRDRFGQLLAGGIVLTIALQAALNIGVVTVVLPTKGIPLPFVSAGGTSMLLSSAAVGVLLNIAKQSRTTSNEL